MFDGRPADGVFSSCGRLPVRRGCAYKEATRVRSYYCGTPPSTTNIYIEKGPFSSRTSTGHCARDWEMTPSKDTLEAVTLSAKNTNSTTAASSKSDPNKLRADAVSL